MNRLRISLLISILCLGFISTAKTQQGLEWSSGNTHWKWETAARTIFRSTDGGKLWQEVTPQTQFFPGRNFTGTPEFFDSLGARIPFHFDSDTILRYLHTYNGGKSWSNIQEYKNRSTSPQVFPSNSGWPPLEKKRNYGALLWKEWNGFEKFVHADSGKDLFLLPREDGLYLANKRGRHADLYLLGKNSISDPYESEPGGSYNVQENYSYNRFSADSVRNAGDMNGDWVSEYLVFIGLTSSHDSGFSAGNGNSQTVYLWDPAAGRPVCSIQSHWNFSGFNMCRGGSVNNGGGYSKLKVDGKTIAISQYLKEPEPDTNRWTNESILRTEREYYSRDNFVTDYYQYGPGGFVRVH